MKFIIELISFIRKPNDFQLRLSLAQKFVFLFRLLLLEISILLIIVYPILLLGSEQYLLQNVLDTLYGKNKYCTDSEYLKISLNSNDGIQVDKFIDLVKDEYDIISLKTLEKLK